jgi:long-chain-alcohol oxidase
MSFPGGAAAGPQVWESSAEHKSRMLEYSHSMTLITLVRDRDSGSVIIDAGGHPRIKYDVSDYDAASALRAVKAGAETMLAAGARRITTTQAGVPSYIAEPGHQGLVDPKWLAWIARVEAAGAKPGWTTYASAHQMGTYVWISLDCMIQLMSSCAMGVSKHNSVINPRGAVWGTENLYVADAVSRGVQELLLTFRVYSPRHRE